jgi:hypothetical protein
MARLARVATQKGFPVEFQSNFKVSGAKCYAKRPLKRVVLSKADLGSDQFHAGPVPDGLCPYLRPTEVAMAI